MSHARKLILVTGCPRSGTTPVGANLALAPRARYLYEPFNPNYGMRAISRFYEVPGANAFPVETFDRCVEDIRRVRLDLKRFDWPKETGVRRLVKRVIGGRGRLAYLRCRLDWSLDTVIWKDPTACFASRQAAERHGVPVLVTVRPATAVAASYKRLHWKSGVAKVAASLEQVGITYPELMTEYSRHLDNDAVAAAMLWYVIYATLLDWAETTPAIRFVSLQQTIEQPLETYQALYCLLGLEWTAGVATKLRRLYAAEGTARRTPSEALPQRAHVSGRSVRDVNTYGRKLLSADETAIVEEIAAGLAKRLDGALLSPTTLRALAAGSSVAPGLVAA
jgi:hypothetical protein